MQVIAHPAARTTTARRPALWRFVSLGTLRNHLLHPRRPAHPPPGALDPVHDRQRGRQERLVAFPAFL
jgi:hypothetical protein